MLTSAKTNRSNHPCTAANYCKQPLTPSPAGHAIALVTLDELAPEIT